MVKPASEIFSFFGVYEDALLRCQGCGVKEIWKLFPHYAFPATHLDRTYTGVGSLAGKAQMGRSTQLVGGCGWVKEMSISLSKAC